MRITSLGRCLACGAEHLQASLNLGHQPPANLLLDSPGESPAYPLQLLTCPDCGHAQLSVSLDPTELFSNYAYESGTSLTLQHYFAELAWALGKGAPGSRVLEIACNDGSLLEQLQINGLQVEGVEPDKALARRASQIGTVYNEFWPCRVEGKFDLIIGLNVLAHTPTPLAFLEAARDVLAVGGYILIQTSQGDMLETGQFDTIYHEHVSYFSPSSMAALCRRAGLRVERVMRMAIHGGSDLYVIYREGDARRWSMNWGLNHFRDERFPIFSKPDLAGFAARANRNLETIREFFQVTEDYQPVIVGAAAKAVVVARAAKIFNPIFIDESPLKIGKFLPGLDEPIRDFIPFKVERPIFVMGAWNFAEELERKITQAWGPVRFMQYFPDFRLWHG